MDKTIVNYLRALDETMAEIKKTPTYYFYNKLNEESGEVAEVASAFMGSRSKQKKIEAKGKTLDGAMLEELGDVFNVVMILCTRHNVGMQELINSAANALDRKNALRIADK